MAVGDQSPPFTEFLGGGERKKELVDRIIDIANERKDRITG